MTNPPMDAWAQATAPTVQGALAWTWPAVDWAINRELIRLRKEVAHDPREMWTADPIFQTYRFCNVRRRDDRVSRWLRENVYKHQTLENPLATIKLAAACRWINWPPTLAEILAASLIARLDAAAIGRMVDERVKRGEKGWTGAYMVRAEGTQPKGEFIMTRVIEWELDEHAGAVLEALKGNTRQGLHSVLKELYGWGSFMAGQVIDDLTWTPLLANPLDDNTWAAMGPGSTRGLNRLLGREPLRKPFREDDFCRYLQQLQRAITNAKIDNVTLHDVQNVLCEYDKYERVRLGQGRPRATYKPESRY